MPRWQYLVGMLVILLLAAGLRLYFLEADAPLELSPTQELNLDGPVTIGSGRDRAVFGEWNPYPGPLQPYRLYPAMNWLAFSFFSLLGTGFWQANLMSVVTGILSIALVAGFANQQFGRGAALFSALFMASNYVFVFYNRDPMAYTTVAFGVSLSLFLWGQGMRRPWYFFFSGVVMAFNTLFVKLPGAAFFPAALLGFFLLWWPRRKELKLDTYAPVLLFAGGAAFTVVAWLAFIYLPHTRVVSQAYYVRTFSQSYTLIENIRFAVQSLLLFGVDFGFNLRMLPLFVLSYGYLFYRTGLFITGSKARIEPGEAVALALLVSTVIMLLFSGIRPLRFQILLIPPMSLVAGLALASWLGHERIRLPQRFRRLFPVYVQVGLAYLFYQVMAAGLMITRMLRFDAAPVDARVALEIMTLYVLLGASLILAIVGTFAFLWRVVSAGKPFIPLPSLNRRVTLVIVLFAVAVGADLIQYGAWASMAEATIVDASRKLAADLDGETVVLGGSYAYTLALEGDLPAVWFYGHSPGEAILATPFTHLVMEGESPLTEEYTNEERIRDNLPQLLETADLLATYDLRGYHVNVYQVDR